MKKTISVNLNRQIFYLDIDAYDKLEEYLNSIKKYFKNQNSFEVVEDIESRIAEKFEEIINKSKKVIQIIDVEKIIEEMGTVDDITGEDEEIETKTETEKIKKKLFRDPENKILTGAAAGFGWYFGIKSIFIRIVLLILFFNPSTTWLAVILYIASWLIIPEAKTNWEKLEMKGKPTTVNELQTAVEEKTSKVVSNIEAKTRNIIQKIFSFFSNVIKFCWIWFWKISGFFALIFTILTIMAVTIGMIFVYLYPNMPYFDFSFLKAIRAPWLEIAYVALGLVILTPFIFIIDLADSLMRLKWRVSVQKIIILLIIWIASLVVLSGIAKINYPQYKDSLNNSIQHLKYINYIDESNSEILKIGKVSEIDISSVKEVKIIEGNENEVKIIGSQYSIKELNQNYQDGKLIINGKSEKWFNCHDCSGYTSTVRVEIKTKNINSLKLDNDIDAWYFPNGNNINIEVGNRVGLKIEGILNKASIKVGQNSVINMLDTKITEINTDLYNGVIKTQAKKIKITGNENSTLIYQGSPEIISDKSDKTNKEKYILSEDYDKIEKAIMDTLINVDGTKKKIKDFDWTKEFEKQSDYGFYNIFTAVRSIENNKVYIIWLIEKNGTISQKTFTKIDNWEEVHYLNLVNDKFLRINGQVYGPDLKEETKEFYIDKTKGILQIKPETNLEIEE
ncbi:MAG: PspC domain-containing protein [Candidatus Shapirobacteria bacterium]|nr:PspC domain-containing protein [Candidatus Shapirobacteria bacterium]